LLTVDSAYAYDQGVLVGYRKSWALSLVLVIGAGCVSSAAANRQALNTEADERASLEKLREKAKLQADRIAELEVRVSLLEAEAKQARTELRPSGEFARETVRIGSTSTSSSGAPDPPRNQSGEESSRSRRSPRPVLRLYSRKLADEPVPSAELPAAPPGVSERLPVAPLAELSGAEAKAKTTATPDTDDPALVEYGQALALVRSRQFDQAQQALTSFLVTYPSHAYAGNAMYWLGEVFYAKRQYQRALEQFETLSTRFSSNDRMPDALLKMGMCHRHLGDLDKARDYFRRVSSQYPNSEAAKIALQEGV
jgi:tol-pal system protein YbgF